MARAKDGPSLKKPDKRRGKSITSRRQGGVQNWTAHLDDKEISAGILILYDSGMSIADIVVEFNFKKYFVKWVVEVEARRREKAVLAGKELVAASRTPGGLKEAMLPRVLEASVRSMEDPIPFNAGRMAEKIGRGVGIYTQPTSRQAGDLFVNGDINVNMATDAQLEEAIDARRKQIADGVRLGLIDAGAAARVGVIIEVAAERCGEGPGGPPEIARSSRPEAGVREDAGERALVAAEPDPDVRQALETVEPGGAVQPVSKPPLFRFAARVPQCG